MCVCALLAFINLVTNGTEAWLGLKWRDKRVVQAGSSLEYQFILTSTLSYAGIRAMELIDLSVERFDRLFCEETRSAILARKSRKLHRQNV